MPTDSDPVYDKIMEKINERDAEMLRNLDYRHEQAVKQDWPGQLIQIKRNQLIDAEDKVQQDRDLVSRFKNLKFE